MTAFTESQQRAIDSNAPITVCMAGAGAGKTATLVGFLGRQVDSGINPTNIAAVTFTCKAAAELRERISKAMGDEHAFDGAMTGTMHAICLRILQAYGDRIGYDGNTLGVADPDDADALLERCAADLGLFRAGKWGKGLSGKAIRKALETCYSAGTDAPDDDAGRIIRAYWAELRQLNLLDFGLILMLTNRLFDEHPDVLETYRRRIRVLTVDECQDLDAIQHRWIFRFPDARLFLAGDLRQSIYGFRQAQPELMRRVAERNPPIELRDNFRSGRAIVDAANRLIAHGGDAVSPMVAARDREGLTATLLGRTDDIVGWVGTQIATGVKPGDIAVIARSHRVLRRIEGRMRDQGVPCYRVGQRWDITDTDEFKTLHRAMRLAANPRDQLAFMLLLDQFGMTTADYAKVRARAAESGRPIRTEATEYGGSLMAAIEWQIELPTSTVIRNLAAELGTPDAIVDFWRPVANLPLKDALAWYATRDRDAENEDAPQDKVTLLTCHAAKGLEFPFVLIAECNEGHFPSTSAIREGTIDDERRVFYVAMTRARDCLVCHYRRPEDQAEERTITEPSRFLFEAGFLSRE